MNYHPDVLAAHAEFGGDLASMQALYDRPDHIKRIEALERENAEAERANRAMAQNGLDLANSWQQRAEAAEADKTRLSEALRQVRHAIMNADPTVLTDTFWMPDNVFKGGTVVDFIDAALSGSGSGWLDIASAPHDGTVVLVFSADAQSPRVQAAWWHDGWWRSYKPTLDKFETENPFRWFPTRWMPLPAAPQQGGE